MTGYINLHAAPINNFHPANKLYVDNQISSVGGT